MIARNKFLVALTIFALFASAASAQTFTGLGHLPGGTDSNAWVSPDGSVVVGYCGTTNGHRAYRWTSAGGMVSLGTLPGETYSFGYGSNSDGSTVVGYSGLFGGTDTAFRWTSADGMVPLGVLPGFSNSYAQAISGDGLTIVGDCRSISNFAAYRWTPSAGMEFLSVLPGGAFSAAYGVDDDGSVIVGYSGTPDGDRACRWIGGNPESLGALAGDEYSYAYGVSADGNVIVGYSGTGFVNDRAFRWTAAEGMVNLGTLPGTSYGIGFAASADGSVIVGGSYGTSATSYRAFMWTASQGMVDLNVYLPTLGIDLTGWTLRSAGGISNDGRLISGIGFRNGRSEAWLVSLGEAACPGDLNGDGAVGLSDLTLLLSNFGTPSGATPEQGDLDGDADVDLSDLTLFLSLFGSTCG